jgi:uncharacterized membrane protein
MSLAELDVLVAFRDWAIRLRNSLPNELYIIAIIVVSHVIVLRPAFNSKRILRLHR